MVAPLGRRTVKGVRDLTLFKHGRIDQKKVAGATGVHYCCFMLFEKGWVSTDFKR
jgi:hypothetical protein